MPKFMMNWNQIPLLAFDIFTTGKKIGYNEIIQITIMAVNSSIEPFPDIMPFSINVRPLYPERCTSNIGKLDELMFTAYDKSFVLDTFFKWHKQLPFETTSWGTKKDQAMLLGHNCVFKVPFLVEFFGCDLYHDFFKEEYRDIAVVANYINDYCDMKAFRNIFNRKTLNSLAIKSSVDYVKYSTLQNTVAIVQIYKEMCRIGGTI